MNTTFENSIIAELNQKKQITRRMLYAKKYQDKPWFDMPNEALTAKINATIDSLINKGRVLEVDAFYSNGNHKSAYLRLVKCAETEEADNTVFENSIIAYLGKRKQATRRLIRTNKCDGKPWSEIPRKHLTLKINATIDSLINKGRVSEEETFYPNGKSQGKYLMLLN